MACRATVMKHDTFPDQQNGATLGVTEGKNTTLVLFRPRRKELAQGCALVLVEGISRVAVVWKVACFWTHPASWTLVSESFRRAAWHMPSGNQSAIRLFPVEVFCLATCYSFLNQGFQYASKGQRDINRRAWPVILPIACTSKYNNLPIINSIYYIYDHYEVSYAVIAVLYYKYMHTVTTVLLVVNVVCTRGYCR